MRTVFGSMRRLCARFGLVAALTAGLAGCGSSSEPPPKTVAEVSVVAAPTLNPDLNGRPSPVVVRIYQLATTELFTNVDFFQVFEQDKAALGPTFISRQDAVFQPGQVEKMSIPIKDGVTALGVVVGFRNYERATWRALAPITVERHNVVDLQIYSQNVQMKTTNAYVPEASLPRCRIADACLTAALPTATPDPS